MTGDLIQDIENSMRQERTAQLWREYGPYLIGGAVLAVLLTGGLSVWQSMKTKQNRQDTAQLLQALDTKDQAAALDKIAPALHPGPKTVAAFSAAGLLMRDGKNEEALKHYRMTAADASLPALYRDLATWLAVRLDWSLHKDKVKAQELLDQLKPLTADAGNPWNRHARIEAAQIEAHGAGDYAAARQTLAPVLADDTADQSMRQRAQALDHIYALQQAGQAPAATAKEPTP